MPRTIFTPLMLIFLLAVLSLSCRAHDDRPGSGSSGLIKDPFINLSGSWTGTWDTTSGFPLDAGTVDMTIVQDEMGGLTGTSDWTWAGGEDCWTSSDMKNGFLEGNDVTGLIIVEKLRSVADNLGLVIVRGDFRVVSDAAGDQLVGTFAVSTFENSSSRCTPAITRADNAGVINLRRQ